MWHAKGRKGRKGVLMWLNSKFKSIPILAFLCKAQQEHTPFEGMAKMEVFTSTKSIVEPFNKMT